MRINEKSGKQEVSAVRFKWTKYIKKWLPIIVLFCIAATVLTYYYLQTKQSYTASVTIEYTNQSASSNYNPDGTLIDPAEIYDAKVIARTLSAMNSGASVSGIRSGITVVSVIPDEEQDKINSALDNGKTYTYTPTEYLISYRTSSSAQYARKVLSNVLSQYFESYGETHVAGDTIPTDGASIVRDGYDYLENAEIIGDAVDDMLGYLKTQSEAYPNWRSSLTGYSFSDMYNEYKNVSSSSVDALFAEILSLNATKDRDGLMTKYRERIASDKLDMANASERMGGLEELIDSYTGKVKQFEGGTVSASQAADASSGTAPDASSDTAADVSAVDEAAAASSGSTDVQSASDAKTVLDSVYNSNDESTEYDTLVNEYVDAAEAYAHLETDVQYCEWIIDSYRDAPLSSGSNETIDLMEAEAADRVSALYGTIERSCREFNAYLGAENIGVSTAISVANSINMKMLMAVAVMLFLVVGCMGAITVGRITELVNEAIYTDKITGVTNRAGMDAYLSSAEDSGFNTMAVATVYVSNLREVNEHDGIDAGNELLSIYGKAVRASARGNAKSYYNGSGRFFIFFPNSSYEHAEAAVLFINDYVKDASENSAAFEYGIAHTERDRTLSVRQLVVLASKQSKRVNSDEAEFSSKA